MIFIDSNIPMYLVGGPHPHKSDARRLLDESITAGQKLVTSAEVFQEILHRYTAIDRRDAIQPAWDLLVAIADEVFPVDFTDVGQARAIVLERPQLSARDALHAAVMARHGLTQVMSFDTGFDAVPTLTRLR